MQSHMPAAKGGWTPVADRNPYKDFFERKKQSWRQYKQYLKDSFRRMPRSEQEKLIRKSCTVVTVGSAVTVTSLVYRVLPLATRLLGVPLIVAGAFILGRKVVGPLAVARYGRYLNKPEASPGKEEPGRGQKAMPGRGAAPA